MRRHGWQLPYHPLQVVAVAVFLALGFAFYVFFVPFVGKKIVQYIVMCIYTPIIISVFCLYIWCAAADPADAGVFKSKKYLHIEDYRKQALYKESKLEGESTSSPHDANAIKADKKSLDEGAGMESIGEDSTTEVGKKNMTPQHQSYCMALFGLCPCFLFCNCSSQHKESSERNMSEDGMFYCSLCKVEVYKYSKHCRVCDKCVDSFDHHCRWINNCIGKRNYRQFFILMVSSLLLLIVQWSTGILVMICCFLDRKHVSLEITTKLGSSFSFIPFVVVVASCTILAMIATLPLTQLFFFHVLLIKKGISTYDYIVALREQEQQLAGGQQSPQMSPASSLTGLSSASSFSTFHRGAWCTPPRLFLEDQFDVVPPETGMSITGKRMVGDHYHPDSMKKKNPGTVKISPWTLARLNADEVSKAAAEARKKSKILQPVMRRENPLDPSSSLMMAPRMESRRRPPNKRVRLPSDILEPLGKSSTSTSMAPLQLEARSAFRTSRAMSVQSTSIVASSPESSLESPDCHPFRVSSSGAEEARGLTGLSGSLGGMPLSRSTSDGYEASGGEDSDRVPSRVIQRPMNWSSMLFSSGHDDDRDFRSGQADMRRL
ncbi:putative protein S-acyltransferase 22 [Ranunculus cassubicifolius]